MDNHPIPQDITGFQFKLVGNMTIKQFIYLAVGAFFAWIFFFILNLPTLIQWPLSLLSLGLGAGIAFIPIDGRPMDVMLKNFISALFSPSQFVYEKEGGKLTNPVPNAPTKNNLTMNAPLPQSQSNQSGFFQPTMPTQESKTTHPHHSFMQDFKESREHKKEAKKENDMKEIKDENNKLQKEIDEIKKDLETSHTEPKPVVEPVPSPTPPPPPPAPIQQAAPPPPTFFAPPVIPAMTIDQMDESEEIEKKEKELKVANEQIKETAQEKDRLQEEVDALKKQLEDALKAKDEALSAPPAPVMPQITPEQDELEKKLIESNREKEALEKELIAIKTKPETPAPAFTPTVAKPAESTQRVRSVPSGMEQSVGIPSVPDAPNLITGIVKDPRGNPLQNILIEVKDQDANPVRAFKTNGLGKFASATSLSNGKYVISFEDTKETHKFDSVELDLVGAPVMPLEIISVDPREELRRELFN